MASRFASFLPPLRGSATVMPWPPWVNTHGYLLTSLRDYDHQLTTAPLFIFLSYIFLLPTLCIPYCAEANRKT